MLLQRPGDGGTIGVRIEVLVEIPLDTIVVLLRIDGIQLPELLRIDGRDIVNPPLNVGSPVDVDMRLDHEGGDVDHVVHGTGGIRLRLQPRTVMVTFNKEEVKQEKDFSWLTRRM